MKKIVTQANAGLLAERFALQREKLVFSTSKQVADCLELIARDLGINAPPVEFLTWYFDEQPPTGAPTPEEDDTEDHSEDG